MYAHLDRHVSRRTLLGGVGAAIAATAISPVAMSRPAAAAVPKDAKSAPNPIPGGIDAPPVGFIHWWLPGPTDATTPFLGIPGFGLDVDPSLMTDYEGFTTFAVLTGQAHGADGVTYNCEFDVRVMSGKYKASNGSMQTGTFAFL